MLFGFVLKNIEKIPNTLNIGCGKDYSILEFYEIASKIINFNGIFKFDINKPQGMRRKMVDSEIINKLGWEPKTTLEEGLKKTYDFYTKEYLNDKCLIR